MNRSMFIQSRTQKHFLIVASFFAFLCTCSAHLWAGTTTWNGTTGNWNDPAKWDNGVPGAGVDVVVPGGTVTAAANMVAQNLNSISITGGAVLFEADFAEGNVQALTIAGLLSVDGGTLELVSREDSSTTGTGVTLSAQSIFVSSTGIIHGDENGFARNRGPGGGSGGAHGGRGGNNIDEPYGSPTSPTTLGSGGQHGSGGGAIKLIAAADIQVDGLISVNAQPVLRGGAGGSIWLVCNSFNGSGALEANGMGTQHGGAGGRIAVDYNNSSYSGTYECKGGEGSSTSGVPGTLSLPESASLDLVVNKTIGLAPGNHNFNDVSVVSGALLLLHSEWNPDGNVNTHDGFGCTLNANSLVINSGGKVSGTGEGYFRSRGPGGGSAGTHGGRAGGNIDDPYGSPTAPTTLGSGGQYGIGGGAIRINCPAGMVKVDGVLETNGQVATRGGAGGSIYITTNQFTGNGVIEANGAGTQYGGGGGRISVEWTVTSYSGTYECKGGVGSTGSGVAGTLNIPESNSLNFTATKDVGFASGSHIFGNFRVVSGVTVVLHGTWNPDGVINTHDGIGCVINANNFTIDQYGRVTGAGEGYHRNRGPGAGSGAAHGGKGGSNQDEPYGSPTSPTTLGSGGQYSRGGGAIRINCPAGTVQVDGTLDVNAVPGSRGGAGGSIYITTNQLTGIGAIEANGAGTQYGGGGGRISIDWNNSGYSGSFECKGGLGSNSERNGVPGTLNIPEGSTLNFTATKDIGLAPGSHTFGNFAIASGVTVAFHGDWNPDGNTGTHDGIGCTLNASNITIGNNASIFASGEGYARNRGPGKGTSASHGGRGFSNVNPYGNKLIPTDLGSGGQYSRGGGAVTLSCPSGLLTIDGEILANAKVATRGGAGGSIYLKCDSLAGSGSLQANGNGMQYGGGGGRIAVEYNNSTFTGESSVLAGTGVDSNPDRPGDVGTIIPGNLHLDDHTESGQVADAFDSIGVQTLSLFRFNLQTNGNKDLDAYEDINVSGLHFDLTNVRTISNGAFTANSIKLYLDNGTSAGAVDGSDTLVSSAGTVNITGTTGTLSFDFSGSPLVVNKHIISGDDSTKLNFILEAEINVDWGFRMNVVLNRDESKIVAAGSESGLQPIAHHGTHSVGFSMLAGSASAIQHHINARPEPDDDFYNSNEGESLSVTAPGVLDNDDDPDGDAISVTSFDATSANGGVVSVSADGSFTYDPPSPDFNGNDTFTYTVSDTQLTDTATVTIQVAAVNDKPVISSPASIIDSEDADIVVPGVSVADADVNEGDGRVQIALTVGNGTLTLNSTSGLNFISGGNGESAMTFQGDLVDVNNGLNNLMYKGNLNYHGPDLLTIIANDLGNTGSSGALEDTETINITLNPVNDKPIASADGYTTDEDTELVIPAPGVLQNDTDVDGDALSVSKFDLTSEHGGFVEVNSNGSLKYVPAENFNGVDRFEYTVFDGSDGRTKGTVTVLVNPSNDPPAGGDFIFTVDEDSELTVPAPGLLDGASDVDGDPITLSGPTSTFSGGTLSIAADGSFTYVPPLQFNGEDSFTYSLSDGNGGEDSGTVTIQVASVNDAPVIVSGPTADPNPVNVNQNINFSCTAEDIDEADTLTWTWDFGDGNTGTGNSPAHTYLIAGEFTVRVRVEDPAGGVDEGQLIVVVNPIDDGEEVGAPGTPPPGIPLSLRRVRLNFGKSNRDRARLHGQLPLPDGINPAGAVVTINFCGKELSYTLDARGNSSPGGLLAPFQLRFGKRQRRWVEAGNTEFRLVLRRENLGTDLSHVGATNETIKNKEINLWIAITLNGTTWVGGKGSNYRARQNVSGRARELRNK